MPGAGYPIEDFLEAITAQLDQTQDALRLKAVNRPLTFALKDFNVDLKVFVEMEQNGRVSFRPAGPNEEGASTVSIGFTTITRPMIEENTVSMEMSQAPTLGELGLKREEQSQLAKIGVRNAAQLKTLQRSAGEETLSRHTGIDILRIRQALNMARPQVEDVTAEPGSKAVRGPAGIERVTSETRGPGVGGGKLADRLRQGLVRLRVSPEEGQRVRRLGVEPGAKKIHIAGRNLIEEGRTLAASLDGQPLSLLSATSLAASFALPPGQGGGRLTLELPDGRMEDYDLFEQPGGAR
jgi:hypothetical protein